jgi:hypothetical protein
MVSWLVPRLRFYGAITLVALYTGCVVMPSVTWAFPRGGAPSHCLSDDHHGAPETQVQAGTHISALDDNAIAEHAGNFTKGGGGKLKCHAGACCGVSCFAAIACGANATMTQPVEASLAFAALDERPEGFGPERIGRPPKFF